MNVSKRFDSLNLTQELEEEVYYTEVEERPEALLNQDRMWELYRQMQGCRDLAEEAEQYGLDDDADHWWDEWAEASDEFWPLYHECMEVA